MDFLCLHSELESKPDAINIAPMPASREGILEGSGAHRNPAQFSAEPLRESDAYTPSNPTPCSVWQLSWNIWKEVTKPQNLGFLESGRF